MSGYKMGQKDDSEVDCACGIPDSGVGMALGYAEGKGIPYHRAIAKYTPPGLVVLLLPIRKCVHW